MTVTVINDMETETVFQRDNQLVSSEDILRAMALGKGIALSRCTVSGEFDINRFFAKGSDFNTSALMVRRQGCKITLTFPRAITFNSCIFEDNVCFSSPWESDVQIKAVFGQDVSFNSSIFSGQVRFSRAVFKSLAGFDGCRFERITTFRGTEFHDRAMFRTALFNGYGLFNASVFFKEGRFSNTCFSKSGNFTDVRFKGHTDFSGVYSKSKSVPVYESVRFGRQRFGEDVTFWRFIKQSCQDAGLYREAGEAFYSEMCAHLCRQLHGPNYIELSPLKKFGRMIKGVRLLPELIFGRFLFGYGERPVRVLVASMIIITVCAVFYSFVPGSLSGREGQFLVADMSFLDSLYFSVTTFTTLGFGDVFPSQGHSLARVVAMFEAISGACLTALFVVCLAKRFSRG
ncbi:MAG: potassium channel family protein [Planctomycetes bacterium]|nr:potassium channel family protein [Planctomycetota bacterium]